MKPIDVKNDPGSGDGDLALLESVAEEEHSSPDFKKEEEKHEDTILSDHPEGTERWIFHWRNCNLFFSFFAVVQIISDVLEDLPTFDSSPRRGPPLRPGTQVGINKILN